LDTPFENDTATGNMGFLNRGAYFRKNRAQASAFRAEGATFIGKLSNFFICNFVWVKFKNEFKTKNRDANYFGLGEVMMLLFLKKQDISISSNII